MDQASINQGKVELRGRMLTARDAIDPVRRLELAEAIHEALYELPAFRDADSVGLYWAGGSEASTTALYLRLAEIEQRRIFLPFVLNGELALTEWRPQDPVVDAEYGSMHPRYRRAVSLDEVDVLLVPGLAFDPRGNRLGSGTGHYDRLLARLDPRTLRVGMCFSSQLVESVPCGEIDQRVQFLASDSGVVTCARDSDRSLAG